MSEPNGYADAADVLSRHGYATAQLALIGAGEQSTCYGTTDVAVLLSRGDGIPDLTGHALTGSDDRTPCNDYAALQWLTNRAADAGVRTPRILAIGADPRPYALIQRAHGVLAGTHPDASTHAVTWFGQLGAQIRRTNAVETAGFGLFGPDGSGGYRGRYSTWAAYLDGWLTVHMCVGGSRPEDERVLNLLLAQRIVTECDVEKIVAKVRGAQAWPVRSVLTHYDNRLDNVVVDDTGISVLDWGLSLAGIGIEQELIKIFEVAPTTMEDPRVAAFLHSYGLSEPESLDAIEGGKLMLILDGIAMSHGWADDPDRLDGIRGWLRTVKRIADTW